MDPSASICGYLRPNDVVGRAHLRLKEPVVAASRRYKTVDRTFNPLSMNDARSKKAAPAALAPDTPAAPNQNFRSPSIKPPT